MSDTAFSAREITLEEYINLLPENSSARRKFNKMEDDLLFYSCLEGAGVDNWSGYDDAIEMYENMKRDNNNG
jgi:hypothetical protein